MSIGEKSPQRRRQVQAADTRRVIVEASWRLFRSRGFVGTTLETIAAESGVAVQTIYNSVGNKAALLSAVLDSAASDTGGAQALEFMREQSDLAPDLATLLEVHADWFLDVNKRTADVFAIISQAAAVDAEVATLETDRGLQRLRRYSEAAARMRDRGGLTSGMTDAQAAAAIWTTAHPHAYRVLVSELGWSPEAYRDWVLKTLTGILA